MSENATSGHQTDKPFFDKGPEEPPPALFSWTRPVHYLDVVGAHLPLVLVTGIPLLLSRWVPCDFLPLKECTFLHLTGYPCPFCGFTRSFWGMAEGNWGFAVNNCPLCCLIYVLSILVFAWNMAALVLGIRITRGRFLQCRSYGVKWVTGIAGILLILNWVYRLSFGLK